MRFTLPAIVSISPMHWQVNLLTPTPRTEDDWWLFRSTGAYAEHDCSSQCMAVWNSAGKQMLAGMQSIAV